MIGTDRWNYGSEVPGQRPTIHPSGKFRDVFERVITENPGEFQPSLFIPDAECEHFVNYARQPAADSFRRALLVNRAETDGQKQTGV